MDQFVVGQILRKLLKIKKRKDFSSTNLTISNDGLEQAEIFYRSNKKATTLPLSDSLKNNKDSTADFLQYQQELEAVKLLTTEPKPVPPAKILKLPRRK